MKLERFDPVDDAGSVRACREVYLAGLPADDPDGPPLPPRSFAGWLEEEWSGDPAECWLTRDGAGKVAGWYRLMLPDRENAHLARLALMVHPQRRRAGLGTALLRAAAARARDLGRSMLAGQARSPSPGAAFARAAGARPGITEVRRVLDVAALPASRLASLRRGAREAARGYSLLSWEGAVPREHLAGVAAVHAAEADIPREPGHEAMHWDPERIRRADERVVGRGMRAYTVAARLAASGELAGLTQVLVDPDASAWGQQALTAVARQHRGRRLGLLAKVAMLDLLAEREPQVATIVTFNAEDNRHMIAINEALGFRVLDRWTGWDVDAAPAAAGAA